MMTRHTRGSGNEPIEHVSLDKVPGLGRGGGHGKKGAGKADRVRVFVRVPFWFTPRRDFVFFSPSSLTTAFCSWHAIINESSLNSIPRPPLGKLSMFSSLSSGEQESSGVPKTPATRHFGGLVHPSRADVYVH